jgi:hypothetical protein
MPAPPAPAPAVLPLSESEHAASSTASMRRLKWLKRMECPFFRRIPEATLIGWDEGATVKASCAIIAQSAEPSIAGRFD